MAALLGLLMYTQEDSDATRTAQDEFLSAVEMAPTVH